MLKQGDTMDKDFMKELIKQVMDEMFDDEEILTQETNVAGDIAGYDAPLSSDILKRKFDKNEDED